MGEHDKEIFDRLRKIETKQATAEYKIDSRERREDGRWSAYMQQLKTIHKEVFGNGDGSIGLDEKMRNVQIQLETLIRTEKARKREGRMLLIAIVGLLLDKVFNMAGLASLALRIFG